MLQKTTLVGSVKFDMVSLDGGRSWVWPGSLAAQLHEVRLQERVAALARLKKQLRRSLARHA